MAEQSELQMNLAAIKRQDPYAKDILDTSSHVAFYTFGTEVTNEWEKSTVEGTFFIYSRTAKPLHSIFINNRLSTDSLVEPILPDQDIQSQPPFLLYRNSRNSIRGFWFYHEEECTRIAELFGRLIFAAGGKLPECCRSEETSKLIATKLDEEQLQKQRLATSSSTNNIHSNNNMNNANNNGVVGSAAPRSAGIDIFSMLSRAQEDFNNAQSGGGVGSPAQQQHKSDRTSGLLNGSRQPQQLQPQQQQQIQQQPQKRQQPPQPQQHHQPPTTSVDTPQSVMNFFAAVPTSAIPATAKEVPFFQRMLSQPMSVDQLEKQHQNNHQRSGTPQQQQQQQQREKPTTPPKPSNVIPSLQRQTSAVVGVGTTSDPINVAETGVNFMRISSPPPEYLGTSPLATFINNTNLSGIHRPNNNHTAIGAIHPTTAPTDVSEIEQRQQQQKPLHQLLQQQQQPPQTNNTPGKPALMLPTMFAASTTFASSGTTNSNSNISVVSANPLTNKDSSVNSFLGSIVKQPTTTTTSTVESNLSTSTAVNQSINKWLTEQNQLGTKAALIASSSASANKPEPLTQSQLLQAMNYLIKNDPDFVRKLHEAYLKSFTDMVSL